MHHGQTVYPDRRTDALFGGERGETFPYGRMFPAADEQPDSQLLARLGRACGALDQDKGEGGDSAIASIFTFFGQFIDHDITLMCPDFELGSIVVVDADEAAPAERELALEPGGAVLVRNGRDPRLDLDSVFGGGPGGSPGLYVDPHVDPALPGDNRLRLNYACLDIFRNEGGDTRVISEMRNDENLILVQLHLLVMRLYNVLEPLFGYALSRQAVTLIYHQVIGGQYVPTVCDPAVVGWVETENHPRYRRMKDALRGQAAIGLEFAGAAFRFGHSQLRDEYALNAGTTRVLFDIRLDGALVGAGCGEGLRAFEDLRGDQPVTAATLIDFPGFFLPGGAQTTRRIDAFLPASVFALPRAAIAEPPLSLAERNLRRGADFRLPSGQAVHAFIEQESTERQNAGLPPQPGIAPGSAPLTGAQLFPAAITAFLSGEDVAALSESTPLWYYILREAAITSGGDRLGPVGSRIVAEQLFGLLSEPLPPGGTAAEPALLASRVGASPNEDPMVIQSSRTARIRAYPGKAENGGAREIDGELAEIVAKLKTLEAIWTYVTDNEPRRDR